MKTLNFPNPFNHARIAATAWVFAIALAFVSSASANETTFDTLLGVSAEALSPAAMDAIQGTGSVHIGFHPDDKWNHWDWVDPRSNAGPWNIWVRLEIATGTKLTKWRD